MAIGYSLLGLLAASAAGVACVVFLARRAEGRGRAREVDAYAEEAIREFDLAEAASCLPRGAYRGAWAAVDPSHAALELARLRRRRALRQAAVGAPVVVAAYGRFALAWWPGLVSPWTAAAAQLVLVALSVTLHRALRPFEMRERVSGLVRSAAANPQQHA
jgi:hypothetical protein